MLQRNQAELKMGNMLSERLIILLSCYFSWKIRFDVLDGVNNLGENGSALVLLTILFL